MEIPLIILSHRGQEFLPDALRSINENLRGTVVPLVVDDSGDRHHYEWLDTVGLSWIPVKHGSNAGYLEAMKTAWRVAQAACRQSESPYFMLWEEDFLLTRSVPVERIVTVLEGNPLVAGLNLQRQPVYKIERRLGYMESHQRRGYGLARRRTAGVDWVSRHSPFTTNPGLFRKEVTETAWPTRAEADAVQGGAEPAMSVALRKAGWQFGWYGLWNTQMTEHIGHTMKSGHGY